MPEVRVVIAAAGAGSRAGLPYPKTLHPVDGKPILLRMIDRLASYDPRPTIVVSPTGRLPIADCLAAAGVEAELVVQPRPTGMGDAVLCLRQSPSSYDSAHILLDWGDIPFLAAVTVDRLVAHHFATGADFSFVTRPVDEAYTRVERDARGHVIGIIETREAGLPLEPGERDIGLFLFRAGPVLDLLARRLDGATGAATGEHGFLYVVRHLAAAGGRIEALPIAGFEETISLNRLDDLAAMGTAAS